MARGLILAVQFLTRLPVPAVRDFKPEDLGVSASWFPVVGLLVGSLVGAALLAGALIDPWLGALFATFVWVWVTGALHLDGLADLADALGASHRNRARFLEVLRDPHVGVFGVTALILAINAKLILLGVAAGVRHGPGVLFTLALIAAWSRYATIVWSAWLPALAPGSAECLAWRASTALIVIWGVALAGLSLIAEPVVLLAPAAIWAWGAWLKAKLGAITGDCLGAGVEFVEAVLLLAIAIATRGAQPMPAL